MKKYLNYLLTGLRILVGWHFLYEGISFQRREVLRDLISVPFVGAFAYAVYRKKKHLLETIQGCVKQGIKPDFWVKTLHHHNYWSAQIDLNREKSQDYLRLYSKDPSFNKEIIPGVTRSANMYCYNPQDTIDFMNSLEEPWIAYKILAAGTIHPKDTFRYAFENGADFICVGMYDFQMVEDCNIALDSLINVKRLRPWRG